MIPVRIGSNITVPFSRYFDVMTRAVQEEPFTLDFNGDEALLVTRGSLKLEIQIDHQYVFTYDAMADWIVYTEYQSSNHNGNYHRKKIFDISKLIENEDVHFQRSLIETQLPSVNELKQMKLHYKKIIAIYKTNQLMREYVWDAN